MLPALSGARATPAPGRRFWRQVVALPFLVYGLVVLGLFLLQRQFVFEPVRERPVLAQAGVAGAAEVTLRTADGLDLIAWSLPPPGPSAPVIVLFHGGAGSIQNAVGLLQWAAERGYGALLAEYRGYGGNPGRP